MKSIFSVGRNALMALVTVMALLFMGTPASAQSTIKGKVLDSNGEAIVGASVVVPGTTNGVITDLDGNFELRVAPGPSWKSPVSAMSPRRSRPPATWPSPSRRTD